MAVKYAGKNAVVYASVDGTSAAVKVGGLSAFTVDMSEDQYDTTEFGAGNETTVPGFPKFTGSIEGFYATDETTLWSAIATCQAGGFTNLYLYPTSAAPSRYIGGPAWLSMSLNAGVKSAIGLRGSFGAQDTWVQKLGG